MVRANEEGALSVEALLCALREALTAAGVDVLVLCLHECIVSRGSLSFLCLLCNIQYCLSKIVLYGVFLEFCARVCGHVR